MNYGDYVKEVAKRMDLSQAETKRLIKESTGAIVDALAGGDSFSIPNLGTFGTKVKDQHKSYNPHYEKFMLLPKKRVITYHASASIKDEFKDKKVKK